jgi:hypothetical protein
MKPLHASALLGLLFSCATAVADTFVLKDGTELEGVILREEGENYVLEVQVTKSIKDERVVPKADVTKIVRVMADATAFEKIADVYPVPDLLTLGDYDRRIAAVNGFLKEHPGSSNVAKAKELLQSLTDERTAIAAGGLKLGGLVISAADFRANAVELDARVLAAKIRDHASRSEWLAALRAFSALDLEYRTTQPYQEVLPLVKQVMRTHQTEIEQNLATLDERIKKREAGLSQMSGDDRSVTEAALKEEAAAIESRYQEEKKNRLAWVTPSPYHKASLEDSRRLAESELKRVAALPAPTMDSGKAYREAWEAIAGGDKKKVETALRDAKSARLPARYLTVLEDAAKPVLGKL